MKSLRGYAAVAAVLTMLPAPAAAQARDLDPGRMELSRTALEALLATYSQTAESAAYSDEIRKQARREGALIRARLEEGDFQVGDQIALVVEGEEVLTNTFTVQAGPSLDLPSIGPVSLRGVLRAELQNHLLEELSRFIRQPVVRARSSIRLVITGGVGQAGYHVFPTDALLSDVLMAAGGPAQNAILSRIRIERGGVPIWEGEALQQAIIEGRTVDQLSLRAGDQLIVPVRAMNAEMLGTTRSILTGIGTIVFAITALIRIL